MAAVQETVSVKVATAAPWARCNDSDFVENQQPQVLLQTSSYVVRDAWDDDNEFPDIKVLRARRPSQRQRHQEKERKSGDFSSGHQASTSDCETMCGLSSSEASCNSSPEVQDRTPDVDKHVEVTTPPSVARGPPPGLDLPQTGPAATEEQANCAFPLLLATEIPGPEPAEIDDGKSKKLSLGAKLFVPMASRMSNPNPVWVPPPPPPPMHSAEDSIAKLVPPGLAAPPPGLAQPLRKQAAVFVPRGLQALSA